MHRFVPLLLSLALTNCGAISASIELAQRLEEVERLEALIATSDESELVAVSDEAIALRVATGGIVRYSGQAALVVPQSNGEIILSARAQINAEFASSAISAEFNDWLGYREGDILGNIVSGDVMFTNGVIGTPNSTSEIVGAVSGELGFKGDTFTVDGIVGGQFAIAQDNEGVGGATIPAFTTITQNGVVVDDAEFGFAGQITQ